jgi:hypothetical protein
MLDPVPSERAKDLSDILTMKNSSHAWHLFSGGSVELYYTTVGDCRFDRNRIKLAREMKIRSVVRLATNFEGTIYTRSVTTNRR